MSESELQAMTSEIEAALGSTAGNAASRLDQYFGENALSRVIAAAILLVICVVFIKLLMRLTGRILEKSRLPATMHSFLRTLIRLVLVFIAIMLIAETLGIDTSSLLALFSIAGLAVSLSIQSALTNMTSAVMLLTSKPYQAGDYVDIAGMQGTVREIGILHTKLVTPDGKLISIPNSQAVAESITNYSAEDERRVMLSVRVGHEYEPERVKSALLAAAQDARILPRDPVFARVSGYSETSVEYALRFWVRNSDYWDVYFDVLENVRRVFDTEGIRMSCPQLVLRDTGK